MQHDPAAPERWLESQRRSRARRLAAARVATRRRLGGRGAIALCAAMTIGVGGAAAHGTGGTSASLKRGSASAPRTRRAQSIARPAFCTAASAYQPSPAARKRWHVGAGVAGSAAPTACASCAPVPTFSMRPPATDSAAAVSASRTLSSRL